MIGQALKCKGKLTCSTAIAALAAIPILNSGCADSGWNNAKGLPTYDENGQRIIRNGSDFMDAFSEWFIAGGGLSKAGSRQAAVNGDYNTARALNWASKVQHEEYEDQRVQEAAREGARAGAREATSQSVSAKKEFIDVSTAAWDDRNHDGRVQFGEFERKSVFSAGQPMALIIMYFAKEEKKLEIEIWSDKLYPRPSWTTVTLEPRAIEGSVSLAYRVEFKPDTYHLRVTSGWRTITEFTFTFEN